MLHLCIVKILSANIEQIKEICATTGVKTLYAFGSVTNLKFKDDSDVDMVVDIAETDPIAYSEFYFTLKEHLEAVLNRHVDLLEQKAIKNPFLKKEIDQTKVLIYGN